jgi:hypothetical protein
MKTPIKPFLVEVKRSRSSMSAAKPVGVEPPVFVEARSAPAQVSLSRARQLAEQMFMSLTVGSNVGPEAKVTAGSVFRPSAQQEEFIQVPDQGAAANQQALASPTKETDRAKPRKPRTAKVRTATEPVNKVVKQKAPRGLAKRAVASNAVAPAHQDPRIDVTKTPPPLAQLDQVAPLSLAAEAELEKWQSWGWGPGERWKRRLRHLR